MADLKETSTQPESQPLLDDKQPAILKDPLLLQKISLSPDFYSLTWNATRKDVWENLEEFRGAKISLTSGDVCLLVINFFFFISVVIITIFLLLHEVFTNDVYREATWPIMFLRITLVAFAQQNLQPEFYQAVVKLRFSITNPEKFEYLFFSWVISFFQLLIAAITFFCIILFVCMADSPLELIMNFAGLSVIAELDDWVGGLIVSDKPHGENTKHPNDDYDCDKINETMKLTDKISLISEELDLIDDQNWVTSKRCSIVILAYVLKYTPWILLPLVTIPMNNWLLHIQP